MSRHLYIRIGGHWFVDTGTKRSPDGRAAATQWVACDGPPPCTDPKPPGADAAAAPPPQPEDPSMATATTSNASSVLTLVETLAKNVDIGTATGVINMVAAGISAVDPTIKPTFAADLIAALTNLKSAYASVTALVADVK